MGTFLKHSILLIKVILGKVIMHSSKLGTIGLITIGDIIEEEWLIKNWKVKEREENAYASTLTFVLELTPDFWIKLKDIFNIIDSKIDYHRSKDRTNTWTWRLYC